MKVLSEGLTVMIKKVFSSLCEAAGATGKAP